MNAVYDHMQLRPVIVGKYKMECTSDEKISKHDEGFESSECDLKSGYELVQHSTVHQYPRGGDINDPGEIKQIIKTEPHFVAEDSYDSKDWNEKIKIEDIFIEQDTTLFSSANQINEYDTIQPCPSSLGLPLPKIEFVDVSEKNYSNCKNSDKFTHSEDKDLIFHNGKKRKKQYKYTHPPYPAMITAAIKALNKCDKRFDNAGHGSSRQAILKYIIANYKVGVCAKAQTRAKLAIRRMLADKKIVQVVGCFELANEENVAKPKQIGKRPYQCNQCDKAFATKMNLFHHKETHNVKKPYRCSQCDTGFVTKGSLTWHIKKFH